MSDLKTGRTLDVASQKVEHAAASGFGIWQFRTVILSQVHTVDPKNFEPARMIAFLAIPAD